MACSNPWDPAQPTAAGLVLAKCLVAGVVTQEVLDLSAKQAPCFVHLTEVEKIADIRAEINQKSLETEILGLEKETADIAHPYFLTQKCQALQIMNKHLEAVLKEKRTLRQRLMKPLCQENLPIEAIFHRENAEGGRIIVEVDEKVAKVRNIKVDNRLEGSWDTREKIVAFGFDFCYWSVDPEDPKYASQEVVSNVSILRVCPVLSFIIVFGEKV
uniref:HAUS augmin like complex subunit 2 n=1 Tax=Chrysemys picta bellii TaxID=8478 RepID=A0A8C3HGR8_CHRPI